MNNDSTLHPNVFVSKELEEKAKANPAYAQFLEDIQKLTEHLQGFSAFVIGGK